MNKVEINREPVELYKVLKFEGLVGTGGEAKMVIAQGLVKVNDELETQKRKKLIIGDIIEFNGEKMQLILENAGGE